MMCRKKKPTCAPLWVCKSSGVHLLLKVKGAVIKVRFESCEERARAKESKILKLNDQKKDVPPPSPLTMLLRRWEVLHFMHLWLTGRWTHRNALIGHKWAGSGLKSPGSCRGRCSQPEPLFSQRISLTWRMVVPFLTNCTQIIPPEFHLQHLLNMGMLINSYYMLHNHNIWCYHIYQKQNHH